MTAGRKMKYLKKFGDIEVYLFIPTLFHHYFNRAYTKAERPPYQRRIIHFIRMAVEYLRCRYEVYYFKVNGEYCGNIVVTRGGGRVKDSRKTDIVLGPIWVCPHFRNIGIGTQMINIVLNKLNIDYEYAFEFISNDNIASIKTVEENGYSFYGFCKERGLLKTMVISEDGHHSLFRYSKED